MLKASRVSAIIQAFSEAARPILKKKVPQTPKHIQQRIIVKAGVKRLRKNAKRLSDGAISIL